MITKKHVWLFLKSSTEISKFQDPTHGLHCFMSVLRPKAKNSWVFIRLTYELRKKVLLKDKVNKIKSSVTTPFKKHNLCGNLKSEIRFKKVQYKQ